MNGKKNSKEVSNFFHSRAKIRRKFLAKDDSVLNKPTFESTVCRFSKVGDSTYGRTR